MKALVIQSVPAASFSERDASDRGRVFCPFDIIFSPPFLSVCARGYVNLEAVPRRGGVSAARSRCVRRPSAFHEPAVASCPSVRFFSLSPSLSLSLVVPRSACGSIFCSGKQERETLISDAPDGLGRVFFHSSSRSRKRRARYLNYLPTVATTTPYYRMMSARIDWLCHGCVKDSRSSRSERVSKTQSVTRAARSRRPVQLRPSHGLGQAREKNLFRAICIN